MVKLPIKAIHFRGTIYLRPRNGAIAKAAKEHFGVDDVKEVEGGIIIGTKTYRHDFYGIKLFREDKILARKLNYSHLIIRELKLYESTICTVKSETFQGC